MQEIHNILKCRINLPLKGEQGSAKITVRYRLCLWHRGRTTTPSDETHLTAPPRKGSFQAGGQQHHGQGVDS
ncbi:hypothetical protein VULLAG_LOCUS15802 [Vulpes lagopus]